MIDLATAPVPPAASLLPVVISEDMLRLFGKSDREVKIELAIFFYKRYQISSGKAAKFAGLSRIEFWDELGKREIPINYDVEDLVRDMETLSQLDKKFPAKTSV